MRQIYCCFLAVAFGFATCAADQEALVWVPCGPTVASHQPIQLRLILTERNRFVQTVLRWARGLPAMQAKPTSNRDAVDSIVPAGTVGELFGVDLRTYCDGFGLSVIRSAANCSVPLPVQHAVREVVGVCDFPTPSELSDAIRLQAAQSLNSSGVMGGARGPSCQDMSGPHEVHAHRDTPTEATPPSCGLWFVITAAAAAVACGVVGHRLKVGVHDAPLAPSATAAEPETLTAMVTAPVVEIASEVQSRSDDAAEVPLNTVEPQQDVAADAHTLSTNDTAADADHRMGPSVSLKASKRKEQAKRQQRETEERIRKGISLQMRERTLRRKPIQPPRSSVSSISSDTAQPQFDASTASTSYQVEPSPISTTSKQSRKSANPKKQAKQHDQDLQRRHNDEGTVKKLAIITSDEKINEEKGVRSETPVSPASSCSMLPGTSSGAIASDDESPWLEAVEMEPPEPISLTPPSHPLEHNWVISVSHGPPKHKENLIEIASFQTIESFWACWGGCRATELPQGRRLHIFRQGTSVPFASSSAVRDGENRMPQGRWMAKNFPPSRRDQLWTRVVLALIGEQLWHPSVPYHTVCGIVLEAGATSDTVELWMEGFNSVMGLSPSFAIISALHHLLFPGEIPSRFSYRAVDAPQARWRGQ